MRGWTTLAIAVAIAVCFVMGGLRPSLAASDSSAAEQHPALSDIDARRQALLRQMINSPGNLDLAYDYAQLSAQVGDYEGAISTLERVLIYAPNTPRVELELGILYYQIGSYDVARSYFATVLADPNVPPAITAQVNVYLQQLAVQADPPPFSATLYTALRWESDANAAPANQSITLNGIDFTLDQTATAAADWSSLSVGTIHYSYDLKNQGDRIEFDAIGYNASYFKLTDIDLDFFESTLGPSFNLKRIGMDKSRLFVYGIGDEVLLGNDQYFAGGGGGIRLLSYAADRSVLDARLETRYRDFSDSTLRPTSSLRTGLQTRLGGSYSYFLGPGLILTVEGYDQREDADVGFYADWELGASAGISWTFGSPFAWRYPWTLQVGAGGIHRQYDDPDPTIDPNAREVDRQFWGRAAVVIPVADTWAVIPQVEIRDQQSNYQTSVFDDVSGLVGIQKRF
ncbi:MAG: tetratricopeptide repeat protein [Methyloceanibacter sp.]